MTGFARHISALAVAAAFSFGAGSAGASIIDFDDGTTGSIFASDTFGGLVTASAISNPTNKLALFDAECGGAPSGCSGNDPDLFKPGQGNVLIIQENHGSEPDDDAGGGTFVFDFLLPVLLNSITLLDWDRGNLTLDFLFNDGSTDSTVFSSPHGENALGTLLFPSLGEKNLVQLKLTTRDSLAVAELDVTPVPVPGALPLLIGGLGALALAGRRRRRRAD